MTVNFRWTHLWPVLSLFACAYAQAGRPMIVDDATITAAGNCQLEGWTQRASRQTEYWAVPACNVGGNWELSAGVARISQDSPGGTVRAGLIQAKTLFRPLDDNGWGIGLTLANQFRQGPNTSGDWSVLVPASVSLLDDAVQVHANLGVLHGMPGRRYAGTWGVGAEWEASDGLSLTLETDGVRHAPGVVQAGVRYAVIAERLTFDAGIGRTQGSAGRYITFGLTFVNAGLWR